MCFTLFTGQEEANKGEHGQDFTGGTEVDVLLASSIVYLGFWDSHKSFSCQESSPALKD